MTPEQYGAAFGVHLVELRKARYTSQRDLAERSGVARRQLSSIENGSSSPTVRTVYRLSVALGVKPVDMMPDTTGPITLEDIAAAVESDATGWDNGAVDA